MRINGSRFALSFKILRGQEEIVFSEKYCTNFQLPDVLDWLDDAALDRENFVDAEDFFNRVDLTELVWPALSLFLTNSAYSASLVICGISSAKLLFFTLDIAVSALVCVEKLNTKVLSKTKAINGLSFIAITTYVHGIYGL